MHLGQLCNHCLPERRGHSVGKGVGIGGGGKGEVMLHDFSVLAGKDF